MQRFEKTFLIKNKLFFSVLYQNCPEYYKKGGVFMKRLLIIFTCVALSICSFACTGELNLEMYVSEKRLNAYVYECSDYTLTLYEKECESPYILDGYVGKMQKSLSIRLENFKRLPDGVSVKLNYNGKEITGSFIYNPINSKYTVDVVVEKLNVSSEIALTLISGDGQQSVTLKRVTEGEVDLKKVLSAVSKHARSHIENALSNGGGIEVNVRVIPEDGVNYYYVGIIDVKGGKKSYLVHGKTLKILAER